MSDHPSAHIAPDDLALLLTGEYTFPRPGTILDDLSPEQAVASVEGSPHTIAQLVFHLWFWQDYAVHEIRGETKPPPDDLAESWRAIPTEEWGDLRDRFLADHAACVEAAKDAETCAKTVTPWGHETSLGNVLAGIALHNGFHLGQIVLLRRQLVAWPPPGWNPATGG